MCLPRQVFHDIVRAVERRFDHLDLGGAHGVDTGLHKQIATEGLPDHLIELAAGLRMAESFSHTRLNGVGETLEIFLGHVADVDRKQHIEPIDAFVLALSTLREIRSARLDRSEIPLGWSWG